MAHPIENILRTTMEQLKQIADVNTVIGAPIAAANGTVILPVSKITLGFVSGGGEYGKLEMSPVRRSGAALDAEEGKSGGGYPFIGSSVVGVSMQPTAFLTVQDGHVTVLAAETDSTVDRLVDRAPQLVSEAERFLRSLQKKEKHSDVSSDKRMPQSAKKEEDPS